MNKRKMALITAVVLVVVLVLLIIANVTANRQELTFVEKGLRVIAAPLEKGIAFTINGIGGFFRTFSDYDNLEEENRALREELANLTLAYHEQTEAMAENVRLRQMLEFKEGSRNKYALSAAEVIAENNTNLQHTIVLDKGSSDGIQNDMMVINSHGLIGRVINVLPNSCEVILITDRQGTVGARVYETRETIGVVEGRGSNTILLKMIRLAHDADIVVGDQIVTSGLDGIFSAGIPIGKVTEVVMDADGLTKEATIESFVNFYRLEEVFIVTEVKGSGEQ